MGRKILFVLTVFSLLMSFIVIEPITTASIGDFLGDGDDFKWEVGTGYLNQILRINDTNYWAVVYQGSGNQIL